MAEDLTGVNCQETTGHQFNQGLGALKQFSFDLQYFANDPDRTEQATPKRKQEARKKGQVPKSTELNSVIVLLALFYLMNFLGEWFFGQLCEYLKIAFSPFQMNKELNVVNLGNIVFPHLIIFAKVFLPFGLIAMVIGLAINYAQVGVLFTFEPLKPKFSRINPIEGFKRLFSTRGLAELVKAILKLVVVSYFAYSIIKSRVGMFILSLGEGPVRIAGDVWAILYEVAIRICSFLLLMSVFDYGYQRWEHNKSLRMTKKEIKDEYKQQEGNPQIKGKIRQRQRQIAARRMMQAVPKADVVITNPTHYAVALKYDSQTMAAPTVVAKGEGFIAAKIKEIAKEHQVVMVENRPLAQALYRTVEIGEGIPPKLFQAVAEVLAFVYRLRQNRMAR